MSDYEVVFPRVKVLEGLLESRWGASGRGLHEKLSSVEGRIDSKIISRGRFIASVRNKVAHEDGYQLDDVSGFIQACEQVEQYLRTAPTNAARAATTAATPPQASTPAPAPASLGRKAQPAYTNPTLLEIWRGSYVLLAWPFITFS